MLQLRKYWDEGKIQRSSWFGVKFDVSKGKTCVLADAYRDSVLYRLSFTAYNNVALIKANQITNANPRNSCSVVYYSQFDANIITHNSEVTLIELHILIVYNSQSPSL